LPLTGCGRFSTVDGSKERSVRGPSRDEAMIEL
jgi:hypothetical protein